MTTPNFPVQGRWVYQNDPHLFDTLRKQSIEHLRTAFGRVLGRADDWLFDLAQKEGAVTGSPQIDAMRALRMARASMERGFLQHFESGFDIEFDGGSRFKSIFFHSNFFASRSIT